MIPPVDDREVKRRQKARALITALLLGGLVLLLYFVSIAKIAG